MEIDDKIVKRAAALSGIEIEEEKTEAMVEFFRELVGTSKALRGATSRVWTPFSTSTVRPAPLGKMSRYAGER